MSDLIDPSILNVGDAPASPVSDDEVSQQQPQTIVSTGFGPAAVTSVPEPAPETAQEAPVGADEQGGVQQEEHVEAEDNMREFLERNAERQAARSGQPELSGDIPPRNEETIAAASHASNQPETPEEMRKNLFKDIGKFGKASGEGASALGRLGLRVLRAAADGVLSTAKPPSGGKSDAALIYEAYVAADSKHAEHTKGGMKANAAKLNAIIGMGCMTTCDPVAVGDRAVRLREAMEEADLKPKALFAGLVDVARAQQASDRELSDQAIQEALTKTKTDKTLEKEWEAINKRIEALVTGENPTRLIDQSDGALKISELVAEHLKNYKPPQGADNDLYEELLERGFTPVQAKKIVSKHSFFAGLLTIRV